VPEFKIDEDTSRLKLEIRMAERETGQALFARSYLFGTPEGGSTWRARMINSPKARRALIWVIFTLLLPIICLPLIRRLVARESNLVNLALLLGLTLVDMLVALVLTGFGLLSVWTVIILLLALAGSGYYNYRITAFIQEMG
jgi:hypothetical protein